MHGETVKKGSECLVCQSGLPSSHLHRLIIPDDVLIQFNLLMMSAVTIETCRDMKLINTGKSVSSWLLTIICNKMHGQQNIHRTQHVTFRRTANLTMISIYSHCYRYSSYTLCHCLVADWIPGSTP